jgi:hypothetical protein
MLYVIRKGIPPCFWPFIQTPPEPVLSYLLQRRHFRPAFSDLFKVTRPQHPVSVLFLSKIVVAIDDCTEICKSHQCNKKGKKEILQNFTCVSIVIPVNIKRS